MRRTKSLTLTKYNSPFVDKTIINRLALVNQEADYWWAIGQIANYSYTSSEVEDNSKWSATSIIAFAYHVFREVINP